MNKNSTLKMLLITSISMVVFVAGIFLLSPISGRNNENVDSSYMTVTASETKVTTADLNMRTGPGTSYSVILVIPKGSTVTVTEYSGVWAKVNYSGKTGYCHTSYLKDSTASTETRYTTANLNMRTGPGTNYSVILVIPKASSVQVISSANGWAKLIYNGKTGYASTAYLSTSGSVTPSTSTSSVYTTIASLNLRSGPSTNYPVLLVIPQETVLSPLGTSSGWYKVTYGGKTGYVSGSYISVSDSRAAAEAFVNSKGLSSSTNYLIWVNTKTIHTYVFTGKAGNWTLVKDMLSTVGKESTPTIKGTFSLLSKGSYFYVEDHDDWICKNYSQFYKNYLIHSVVYNTSGQIVDGRLGMRLSKGCVRVSLENARYIYNNVPIGSRVYVN
ncbi:MAG TPA: SH3 domain-containing protein [Proteiniclasticum sp.]|nr:SH3 domain-containing protein [Proteiniclasticum sp.]